LVDALVGQQQVVIKSLEEHYRKVAGIAGATIMGDGKVALIIDADSIATTYTSSQIEELLSWAKLLCIKRLQVDKTKST